MATVQIQASADGFWNNISGWYGQETFNLSRNTSSSNGDYADAYVKFTTAGSGIGASDTITSVVFWWYVTSWDDVNSIANWVFYTDINSVWDSSGAWTDIIQPDVSGGLGFGTVLESPPIPLGSLGWNSKSISVLIPHSGPFGVGINCALGDTGPAQMTFDARETAGSNEPYVIITYTPAAAGCSPASYLLGRS